jgi:hypothetical protein
MISMKRTSALKCVAHAGVKILRRESGNEMKEAWPILVLVSVMGIVILVTHVIDRKEKNKGK